MNFRVLSPRDRVSPSPTVMKGFSRNAADWGLRKEAGSGHAPLGILVFEGLGHLLYSSESAFHRALLVRVDETARGRREHAAGNELLPVDALLPQGFPEIFKPLNQGGNFFLPKGFEACRHDAPDKDASTVEKSSNGRGIG